MQKFVAYEKLPQVDAGWYHRGVGIASDDTFHVGDDDETDRPLLARLRDCTDSIDAPFVRSAFVGNAGVVEFDEGTTIALKAETHNHPSAVEPFGGANTGVGGVIRDVLGIAHRPIARSPAGARCDRSPRVAPG